MIHVLFATNQFDGLLLTTISMVKHTKCPIHYHIITMSLPEIKPKFIAMAKEKADYIEKVLKTVNPKSTVRLIDLTDMFKNEMINSVNIQSHFSPYAMLRLFADRVDGMPDKIIYLDTDVLINNDLQELYNIDVEHFELACVRDAYRLDRKYFNAGVLLMNLKRMKETNLLGKARHLCLVKKMLYMDQAALNICSKERKMLPLKFNAKDKYFPEIVCHHFCNVREGKLFLVGKKWWHRIKPWEIDFVKAKMSAYNDILDDFVARKTNLSF